MGSQPTLPWNVAGHRWHVEVDFVFPKATLTQKAVLEPADVLRYLARMKHKLTVEPEGI